MTAMRAHLLLFVAQSSPDGAGKRGKPSERWQGRVTMPAVVRKCSASSRPTLAIGPPLSENGHSHRRNPRHAAETLVLRDETRPIQREYCRATAITTDGEKRALWYLIERGFGFAGIGSNIEFCLSGLDPWYVYGAQCASVR